MPENHSDEFMCAWCSTMLCYGKSNDEYFTVTDGEPGEAAGEHQVNQVKKYDPVSVTVNGRG